MLKSDAKMWNFYARTASRLRWNTPELRPKPGSRDRVKIWIKNIEKWRRNVELPRQNCVEITLKYARTASKTFILKIIRNVVRMWNFHARNAPKMRNFYARNAPRLSHWEYHDIRSTLVRFGLNELLMSSNSSALRSIWNVLYIYYVLK